MAPPLIDKLMECAKAIEDGELKHADSLFREIGLQSSTETNLATRKVVRYFAEALVRRLYQLYPRNPMPLVSFREDMDILGCKFEPFLWFASHTIMPPFYDALRGKKQVHIIDFSVAVDIWQHATLMKVLSEELGSRLSYRITLVGPKLSRHLGYLKLIRVILSATAENNHIDFEYEEYLANSVAEIVGATLQLGRRSKEEAVVVEWEFELHKFLAVPSAVFNLVMSKLKDLKPEVMVIVEQEADHNSPDLVDRLAKSFKYYSVLFDSLKEDKFEMLEDYRALWERIFRRKISKVVAAEGVGHAERHETWAQWRDRLFPAGFHPARIVFRETMAFNYKTNQYRIEEKNRRPLLCRLHYPFAVSSAWKPDVTQDESLSMEICDLGSMLGSFNIAQDASRESGKASISVSHEDDADDDIIMMKGNIWSTECFSINQVAASAEIFDILEYVCHVNHLPMALTWISDRREDDTNSGEKFRLHIVDTACFVNDLGMKDFFEACVEGPPLEEGQGVAGKALQSKMQFVPDVAVLDAIDYPFLHVAWEFGLHAVLAIKLASTYMSGVDYILEFVFPLEMRESSAQSLLVNEIVSILQKNSRNAWIVCNEELSRANICSEVEIMAEEVGTTTITPAAIPASQPPELSEIGSLNSSQIRELCNIFKPPGDEVRVTETHDQEVEQQNSIFRPVADHFNTSEVEIMAEEVGTNTITQAAIPGSQPPELSGCLSSFSWLNVNPPGDEVRVPETQDQEVEQQNSTFRPAADHFNTSEVEIMAAEVGTNTITQAAFPGSQPPELSEIGGLSSISWLNFNPPGDEVRVPETQDQEVEQQNSTFRPAADHSNTGTSSKRRRTSNVWQYFDKVIENGKVWAKCRNCSKKYRGESTRGTTNLRKHLRSCTGKK